jgi:hypothetical protein
LLRTGTNTVSLSVTTQGEAPRLRTDFEATTSRGERVYIASNGDWRSRPGHVPDWHLVDLARDSGWQACRAETGYLRVVPRRILRELGELQPSAAFWLARTADYVSIVGLLAMAAWVGCRATAAAMRWVAGDQGSAALGVLPDLALVPSTLAAATGWLMTWDYAWSPQDIYQPHWLAALLLLVVMQWLLVVLFAPRKPAAHTYRTNEPTTRPRSQHLLATHHRCLALAQGAGYCGRANPSRRDWRLRVHSRRAAARLSKWTSAP